MEAGPRPGDTETSMESDLPVPLLRPVQDEMPFQLEASREGIRLRLDQALIRNVLQVRDLRMEVRRTPRSLDLSAGPRSLRSVWSSLLGLEVFVRLQGLRWEGSGGVQVESVVPATEGLWVRGRVQGVPFSVRVLVMAAQDPDTDLELRFHHPRVFGWAGVSWNRLGVLAVGDPGLRWAQVVQQGGRIRVEVLAPLLRALLAERGWKVPDHRGVRFLASRQEGASWGLCFGRDETGSRVMEQDPGLLGEDSEFLSEEDLRERFRGHRPVEMEWLIQGLDHPRLWSEVLGRCREIGEERPDRVEASLVALLLAERRPDWVGEQDRFRWIQRLVAGLLAEEEGLRDLRWGAGWIGEATRRLPPESAWALLEEMLSLGVAEPDLLRVASVCLERIGRSPQAEALRSRMLALASGDEVEGLVDRTLATLDQEGLSRVADDWLERLLERPEEWGLVKPARKLRKVRALRRTARDPGGALEHWRALLEEDPLDPEVQDVVRMAVREDSQALDVANRVVEMAEGLPERRALLRYAASLVEHRPGLRGKAVRWYEESLPGDPHPEPVFDALERLYRLLDRRDAHRRLLERRIAAEPESPRSLEFRLERAREALRDGDDPTAARLLREVLDRHPTHPEVLRLSLEFHRRTGNLREMREVEEVLRDLEDAPRAMAQAAGDEDDPWVLVLSRGEDPEAALPELVRMAAEAVERPPEALRLQEFLERILPSVQARWGARAAADLRELAAWIRDSLPDAPGESRRNGR